jgi:hypothetical protein
VRCIQILETQCLERFTVDSTVGDVVQLVRILPRRWLESRIVTAAPSLGIIIRAIQLQASRPLENAPFAEHFDLAQIDNPTRAEFRGVSSSSVRICRLLRAHYHYPAEGHRW